MANEAIEGYEGGAYVTLDTFHSDGTWEYHFSWGVTKNGLQEQTEKAEGRLANMPQALGAARAPLPTPVYATSE